MSGKNPYQLKNTSGGVKSLNSGLHNPLTEDEQREKLVYLAFNKPVGIECTTNLDVRDNIVDYIKSLNYL